MNIRVEEFEGEFAELQDMPPAAALENLTGLYLRVSAEQRAQIRSGWQRSLHQGLPDWHKLACDVDEGRSPRTRVQMWLTWLCINARRSDWRDDLISLCHCYHAARFAGLEEDTLFEKFAVLAGETFGSLLRRFVQRTEAMKSLEAFEMYAIPTAIGMQILAVSTPWPAIVAIYANSRALETVLTVAEDVAFRFADRGQYGGDIDRAVAALRRRVPGLPKAIYSQALDYVLTKSRF